jgi:hypothetical protein
VSAAARGRVWGPRQGGGWGGVAAPRSAAAARAHTPPPHTPPHPCSKARPGSRCPDAAAARDALATARARLLEFSALVVTGPDPSPASEVLLTSMDESEAPRRPAPASPDWMLWLVDQLELDEAQVGWGRAWEPVRRACGSMLPAPAADADTNTNMNPCTRPPQEELLMAILSSKEARMAPGLSKRDDLLRECSQALDAPALLDELVAQLSAGLTTYQVGRCGEGGGAYVRVQAVLRLHRVLEGAGAAPSPSSTAAAAASPAPPCPRPRPRPPSPPPPETAPRGDLRICNLRPGAER